LFKLTDESGSTLHEGYVKCLQRHGHHLKKVKVLVDQGIKENRHCACQILEMLSVKGERLLSTISVGFTGENPLFYAGAEFLESLRFLFGAPPKGVKPPLSQILHVDLSGLSAAYDDQVFNILAENNPQLLSLNILNKMIVCKVSPTCILNLVQKCRKLQELFVYHCSLSDDVLQALTEDGRLPIKHLAIVCRREAKYSKDISTEAWQQLVNYAPDLRVSLGFDHTCPLRKISDIMKSEIPVRELRLETFTRIDEEVNLASAYYSNTLETLVLNTINSQELGNALINLSLTCKCLRSLYVYCVLNRAVIEEILANCPKMKESKNYILKWKQDPEPWVVVGVEEGE